MSFHEQLKELRKMHHFTQKQMATLLSITERAYRNYELGRNEPSISDLVQMADVFNVSLDYLVDRNYPPSKPSDS